MAELVSVGVGENKLGTSIGFGLLKKKRESQVSVV
jgi:hypothetical protein